MSLKSGARKKWIAAFFSGLLVVQNFYPTAAYALTSGPAQPEMQKFQPAGASDMVDLFSGDFKYDIPLMDVGGYPLNLTYHSGFGMEDEASWVGAGWTLSPGSMNRTMRGLPDDFTGDNSASDPQDAVRTVQHQKELKTIGGQLTIKPTALGFAVGKASLHLDVHKSNYWGIGAKIGGGVNFALDQSANTSLTAGLQLNSDNRDGVTIEPNFTITANTNAIEEANGGSLTGGFKYNTRSGLQSVNLGQSFKSIDDGQDLGGLGGASFEKTFIHTYTPSNNANTTHTQSTFSLDLGPTFFGGYVGIGGQGYVISQKMAERNSVLPAYGYMNYTAGTHNPSALLDFNREKDGVFNISQPAIPIPVATADYFVATNQAGVQQFRPVFNGNYIVYDHPYTDKSKTVSLGVSVGGGNLFQVGAQLNLTSANTITHEWTKGNRYLDHVNDRVTMDVPESDVYFKQAGEQTQLDADYFGSMGSGNTQKVPISIVSAGGPSTSTQSPMTRAKRDVRTSTFSYLTAQQATYYGLDKRLGIDNYVRVDPTQVTDPDFGCTHKPHHISEVTVTDKDGKRMVYGIPVYNLDQEEVSFSVPYPGNLQEGHSDLADPHRRTGLVNYNAGVDNSESNTQGRLNLFNRKSIPPYSTSFLLTGILSPDYVDKTGDGISDDDLGTAVKFWYSALKIGTEKATYQWRAPFDGTKANYNEGFFSDHKDDKASYVYGKKEVWYLDSIRTATLVAVFYRSPREDALGVSDENNSTGPDKSVQLQKLDKIALFSRADLMRDRYNAVPIKVVHFEYDYSLFPGMPNTMSGSTEAGKLTLKKVYFTFGNSSRGQTNPYLLTYDAANPTGSKGPWGASPNPGEGTDHYAPRQTDRWGTYRQSWFTTPSHIFYNSDFPYSLQPAGDDGYDARQLADLFSSKWQLSSIVTPTGATINVQYESDDYCYVQDRKAMMMCQVVGFDRNGGSTTGMIGQTKIFVKVPVAPTSSDDFINTYLSGPNGQRWTNFFYKMMVNLDNKNAWEYVHGYAQIDYSKPMDIANNSQIVGIPVVMIKQANNPISVAAWQMLQQDLPQYAYANYDNSNVDNLAGDVKAAVKSIIQSFGNLRELTESFQDAARAKHYGDKIDASRSLIRLNFPVGRKIEFDHGGGVVTDTYGKLGGGARVKKVTISDNWQTMSLASDAKTMTYGVLYDYTMIDDQKNIISSGVASYEPEIGNEENPFHEPVNYTDQVQWSFDRYNYMEKPYGESYFPSPSVGYSQVKVTPFGGDANAAGPIAPNTGYIVNQFYTAREFPTQADYLPLDEQTYEYDVSMLIFGARYTHRVATSQGFKITLNDMHGKPKSVATYDNNKQLISETDYFYNVADNNAQQKQLNNTVLAMQKDGTIPTNGVTIATDVEIVTDMRESNTTSSGTDADANAGGVLSFFPWPFAGSYVSQTGGITSYNSASLVKVIHQYGLLKEVRTTKNGSTLTADNLVWDAQTGDVLLTRNQNEFNDYTYALNYPGFRAYDGMAGAYENIGTVLTGLRMDTDPKITDDFFHYLSAGDELVEIDQGMDKRGWIIQTSDGKLRLVDAEGNFITDAGNYMVIRSGRRNMLTAGVGSVVTMTNPLVQGVNGYSLVASVGQRVLDAKAVTYKDEWEVPVPNFMSTPTTNYINQTPIDFQGHFGVTASLNYNITNFVVSGQVSDCHPDVFSASVTRVHPSGYPFVSQPTRGFLDFGIAPTEVGNGSTITSVKLSLKGKTAILPDAAYIKRTTGVSGCNEDGAVTWDNKPVTTETDRVLIGQSTDGVDAYSVDLTTMYKNWLAAGNIGQDFSIGMVLVDETIPFNREETFYGKGSIYPPTLTISYSPPGQCTDPVNNIINPYVHGVKGNWRPQYVYAYQSTRNQTAGNAGQAGGTNIRNTGYYNGYTPFWISAQPFDEYGNVTLNSITPKAGSPGDVVDNRWVWAARSVLYDQKGNEVENRDALKRSSSVLFGYQKTLPTATATNARHSEIGFDGFEDYYFALQSDPAQCPMSWRPWNFGFPSTPAGGQPCFAGNCIVTAKAHSGNYSLNLISGGSISVFRSGATLDPPENILGMDVNGHDVLLANNQAGGFRGISTNAYVLNFWVNDNDETSKTVTGLTVSTAGSGAQTITDPTATAVVEGWKQVRITIPAGTTNVTISSRGNLYVDDIRVFPFDAVMKSFVYDDQSLRLMAQLDENNFAVFYEYDQEGTPIRVKKETEKGIMTVKESRQSLRAH